MRSKLSKIAQAAIFGIAMAFTFSCSSDDGDGGGGSGTLTDSRDNKSYKYVKIGSKTWMAENLNYNASGSVCYENSESNCTTYGRLYDWSTAMSACPQGWHLPSDAEWTALETTAGDSSTAGTKLKATSGWDSNGNGTDDYGFSALPGGGGSSGIFLLVGRGGYWWSATEDNASDAGVRAMGDAVAYVDRGGFDKTWLFSVRCVQD